MQVIDEQLLQEGSNVDSKVGDFVDLAPRTTILELSFKNIGRIENLNGFSNVVKLCLDNNLIEKIMNLEHLTQLRWLDLSFNKIEKIEGLRTCKELLDLSLFGNKISIIEGLTDCTKLQCLSLGNNAITSLEQIIKLRQCKELRMLTLAGNEVSKSNEYKNTALAYLKDLKYFDYSLVDIVDVIEAKNEFFEFLEELKESEKIIQDKASSDRKEEDYRSQLQEGDILFADALFDELFHNDNEIDKLKPLPRIKDLVELFRTDFKSDSIKFIKEAMELHKARKVEVEKFNIALKLLRVKDDEISVSLVEKFSSMIKAELSQLVDANANVRNSVIENLVLELDNVCDELMSIEIRQVEKFEALLDEFDNRLGELKTKSLDLQQAFFRTTEDNEEKFTSKVKENIADLIDKHSRDELAEDFLEDDAVALVLDKDVCLGYVTTSHEMHVGKILKREEEARTAAMKGYRDEVERVEKEGKARNRDRVLQIYDFGREKKAILDGRLHTEDDEAFEDDFQS